MAGELDLVIHNARLRSSPERLLNLGIAGGRIVSIESKTTHPARNEIDAGGNLVTESFVNPHLHLDKVYTLATLGDRSLRDCQTGTMGAAMTAIRNGRNGEGSLRPVVDPSQRPADRCAGAHFGCTHTRAFADVDTKARLAGVQALLQVRDEWRGVVEIQVVAIPQDERSRAGSSTLGPPVDPAVAHRCSQLIIHRTSILICKVNHSLIVLEIHD